MISISKPIKDSNRIQYYLEMARADYYANRYETPGYWAGKGAELLGLSGPVTPEVLQNLFDGFSPDGRTKLVQNAGSPDRQRAIDLTPAPPKPFSVYWAMASPEERIISERIHDEAVQAAREFLEEKAGFTRRGHGGKEIEPASMVFACFEHITSRENDPQPHTHLLAINIAIREDGTSGALHNKGLFVHRAEADMVYRLHLVIGMRTELGLKLEEEEHGFRIVGLPQKVCDFFSKRHAKIVDYKESHGLEGAVAGNIAALQTRPAKKHIAREDLFPQWHAQGRAIGWGPEQARELSRDKKLQESFRQLVESTVGGLIAESARQAQAATTQKSGDKPEEKNSTHRLDAPGPATQQFESHQIQPIASMPKSAPARKEETKAFKQVSKGRYELKHRRWGNIVWDQNLGVVKLRIQKVRLFPNAPSWNPISKIEVPAIRIVPWKIKLFESVPPHNRPKPKVLWKKSFLFAELRLQQQQILPETPAWSPGQKAKLPRLKVGWKSSEPPKSTKTEDRKQSETHGMGHSH